MSPQADTCVVVSPAEIRYVLGHFATGITVISGLLDGVPFGFTCQSFSSLSLEPALVGFSVSRSSTSWPKVRQASSICINVLAEDQADVSRAFGRSGTDKFTGLNWSTSPSGAPLLDDVAAFVDARVWAEYDGGDHTIVAASVLGLGADGSKQPLIFHRGGYGLSSD